MKEKKILVFAGSNSSKSINKHFAHYVVSQIKVKELISIDLNNFQMPIYSEDIEELNGFPDLAYMFLTKIKESDAIILSLAEHNGSYSTAFKNILDWASRVEQKVFQDKPMLLLSTSDGQRGGQTVLKSAVSYFPFLGADIKGHFSLPNFSENFNRKIQTIENKKLKMEIYNLVRDFETKINTYENV